MSADDFLAHLKNLPSVLPRSVPRSKRFDAAIKRRVAALSSDYFHRAIWFGVLWDLWNAFRSRSLTDRRTWHKNINGRDESI